MRTIAQRSGSEPQRDQWPRSPVRGSGRTSSSPATAIHPAPCISRPSTGRPQSRASTVRHGSEMLPTLGFPCSSSDKIAQLASDLWPSCPLPRFPAPERRETNTMPAKDGLRLNDMRRTEQAWPESGQPHHQGPVTAAQSKARRRTPQGDAELKAKEQVLGFKPARRLEEDRKGQGVRDCTTDMEIAFSSGTSIR